MVCDSIMGVEYRNILVPRDRDFIADDDRIRALIERLRAEQWVLTPDNPVFGAVWPTPSERHQTGGWAEPFMGSPAGMRERREKAIPIPLSPTTEWLKGLRDCSSDNPQADELALHFEVSSGDESFCDLDMPYPLAYGEDESGYHDIFVYASRDFVWNELGGIGAVCVCGAQLAYDVEHRWSVPISVERRIRSVCPSCSRPWRGSPGLPEIIFRFAVVVDCGKGWPAVRRVGEPEGIRRAMEAAGHRVIDEGVPPRTRSPEDDPDSPAFDASVLRSVDGDPAPPLADTFVRMVEETMATSFVSIPEFY